MLKYEEELKQLTKRGTVDTAEVVDFLTKTSIIKDKELYISFLIFIEQASHNGYLDAFEFVVAQQKIKEELNSKEGQLNEPRK